MNKASGVLIGIAIAMGVAFMAWCLGSTEFRL